jgi:hypothetical protein
MFYQTNRTITDIPTGRKLRLFTDDIDHKWEYRDEDTGERVNMSYVNLMRSPVFIRTEDGQTLTVQGMHGVNDSLKVTHIKYYEEDRFKKL